MIPTREQIESASTKGLQDYYQQMVGTATLNRNKKALVARLLRMLDERPPAFHVMEAGVKDLRDVPGETVPTPAPAAPKSSKKARTKGIAERVKAKPAEKLKAKATPARVVKPRKTSDKAKPAAKKPKVTHNPVTAGERAKAKKPRRQTRADSNTRKVLAQLTEGQELQHAFRGGLTVKATVVTPPDLEGNGGKFRCDKKIYGDLREIQREQSNTEYNVLLFWGLKPWPKHRKDVK